MKKNDRPSEPRKTLHQRKIEAAEKAIEELFSDTSVPEEETISDLKDIMDQLRIKIGSLRGRMTPTELLDRAEEKR